MYICMCMCICAYTCIYYVVDDEAKGEDCVGMETVQLGEHVMYEREFERI